MGRSIAWLVLAMSLAVSPVMAQQAAEAAPKPPAPRVRVTDFKVTGNTLLPQPTLDAALDRYKGERTLDELKQAAATVQELYGKAGYGGVIAFLPEQTPAGGVVEIQVVEGRLADVVVQGNSRFSEANIRASLPALQSGTTPNMRQLDAQVQMANENPSKQVQVLLQPGQRMGDVRASVAVTEQSPTRWWVGLDDTGDEQTGRVRANAGWQHANLFDRDHVASAQVQASIEHPDDSFVISGAYRVPFYGSRLLFDAFAAYADVDAGTTATLAGGLRFTGKGRLFGVRLTRLLDRWGEIDQRVSVSLDNRNYQNNCTIEGLPPGACGPAGESVAVQPLGLEYALNVPGVVPIGVAVSIQHNLQLGGGNSGDEHFEAVRPGAEPHYTLLRLAAAGGLGFAEDWQVLGRFNVQWTSDALVPSEQFGIGGAASVRGYEEREVAGDRGAALSIELVSPNVARRMTAMTGDLRLLVFGDVGWVENRLQTPCLDGHSSCTLSSVGIGARFVQSSFKAGLYVAQALKAAFLTGRNDTRVHFFISYAP
jgi:hemolysin activation/secretion protein